MTQGTTPLPTRRLWGIIALVCVPVFLGSVDLTVVSAFLPTLILELYLPIGAGGISGVSGILTSYLLAYAISLFLMGRVSDFIGRRSAFAICLVLYVLGALLVINYDTFGAWLRDVAHIAISNLDALLFGRAIQALGAGAITAIALALVGDLFPQGKRAVPLGVVAAVDTVGWLIGAAYAGLVVQVLPWRAIFLINIPLVLVALIGMLWALRGVKTQRTGLFPLIRLGIFAERGFLPAMWVNAMVGFCLFIALISTPLLVNVKSLWEVGRAAVLRGDLLTMAALISGLTMGAFTIPLAIATVFGGRLQQRLGVRLLTIIGLVLGASGFAMLWQFLTLEMSYVLVGMMMAIAGAGLGLTFTPIILTALDAVREAERGIASSLILGIRMASMTLAVSTLGTYTDNRVIVLVQEVESGGFLLELVSPADYPLVFFNTYINATVQSINEMALLGVLLCMVAMIGAVLLPKRKTQS